MVERNEKLVERKRVILGATRGKNCGYLFIFFFWGGGGPDHEEQV